MARSLREQLRAAFEDSGLTLRQLLDRSALEIDETSLSRKLGISSSKKPQSLRTEEAEALARALRVTITAGREARAS